MELARCGLLLGSCSGFLRVGGGIWGVVMGWERSGAEEKGVAEALGDGVVVEVVEACRREGAERRWVRRLRRQLEQSVILGGGEGRSGRSRLVYCILEREFALERNRNSIRNQMTK